MEKNPGKELVRIKQGEQKSAILVGQNIVWVNVGDFYLAVGAYPAIAEVNRRAALVHPP